MEAATEEANCYPSGKSGKLLPLDPNSGAAGSLPARSALAVVPARGSVTARQEPSLPVRSSGKPYTRILTP